MFPGVLDFKMTVWLCAAQNLPLKIGPLQCSKKLVKIIPLQCIFSQIFPPFFQKFPPFWTRKLFFFSIFHTLIVPFFWFFFFLPLQRISRTSNNRPSTLAHDVGQTIWVPPPDNAKLICSMTIDRRVSNQSRIYIRIFFISDHLLIMGIERYLSDSSISYWLPVNFFRWLDVIVRQCMFLCSLFTSRNIQAVNFLLYRFWIFTFSLRLGRCRIHAGKIWTAVSEWLNMTTWLGITDE